MIIRRHPVIVSVCLMGLLGSAWFYLFQTSERDKYNAELGFDLVRLVAAVHELEQLDRLQELEPGQGPDLQPRREAAWHKVRFVLSRWEAEMDNDRREIIKLMKRAVVSQPSFDNAWMQQYSGRITMHDIGREPVQYPLYHAASRIMQDNLLHLSAEERRQLAQFTDSVFTAELELLRRTAPESLGHGGEEAMVAAFVLQDIRH